MATTGGSQCVVNGKTHYQRNKAKYIAAAGVRRNEYREWYRSQKDRPCMDCGVKYPHYVMDFDHRDPGAKVMGPSRMMKLGWAKAKMQEELDKCDVVCANCHRIRTHGG